MLSAMVWLRPSVIHKNSSAIYLGSLAINDTIYLLLGLVVSLWGWLLPQFQQPRYLSLVTDIITATTRRLESLLVLAFSVERLIAVCYPFHVRTLSTANTYVVTSRPTVRLLYKYTIYMCAVEIVRHYTIELVRKS